MDKSLALKKQISGALDILSQRDGATDSVDRESAMEDIVNGLLETGGARIALPLFEEIKSDAYLLRKVRQAIQKAKEKGADVSLLGSLV